MYAQLVYDMTAQLAAPYLPTQQPQQSVYLRPQLQASKVSAVESSSALHILVGGRSLELLGLQAHVLSGRESSYLRWSGKKRDSVDEILVEE